LIGLNMVFRRSLLDELGWFDTSLSQIGYKRMGGEDTMMQIEAWGSHPELKVFYDPALTVEHLVPARKMSLVNVAKMYYDMSFSQAYFWVPEAERLLMRRRAPYTVIRITMALILKFLPEMLFRDRRRFPHWQNYVYEITTRQVASLGSNLRYLADSISEYKL